MVCLLLTDKDADDDDFVGLVVQNVEQDDERLEDIEEDRTNRETLQRLAAPPELDIYVYVHVYVVCVRSRCCKTLSKILLTISYMDTLEDRLTILEGQELKHAV